ncbi:hypothetical protein DPEC_G00147510 [Dallia pectoralis]|uniref:Uncharacterized protein n=1 Tax=Dallia pectoralis TaxID=75939 RepID=A0ACC2GHZ5_DALPE|nr:hypothetical protein DPEC_G00147510 [Dallia pectoralis]
MTSPPTTSTTIPENKFSASESPGTRRVFRRSLCLLMTCHDSVAVSICGYVLRVTPAVRQTWRTSWASRASWSLRTWWRKPVTQSGPPLCPGWFT